MHPMSLSSRFELLRQLKKRYLKAPWKEKRLVLDEACSSTGLNRKYVITRLGAACDLRRDAKRQPTKRKAIYGNDVVFFLKKIWETLDYPCGERLKPMLPEMVRKSRQFHELDIGEEMAAKLCAMSRSTIDDKLSRFKKDIRRRIQGTTKPGSLLKKQIPIRTSSWEEKEPGFAELDTVAHCGDSAEGMFAFTLNTIDLLTAWDEMETVMGKGERGVMKAIDRIRERSPVGFAGIDPDNGSEFINWNLFRYCEERDIKFTRGRPYQKNDNAHIEQKNWTHVRKVYGYARIGSHEIIERMNDLNRNELRLYKNFFQSTIKLIEKRRVGSHGQKIKRVYDTPKTPYVRVLACDKIASDIKLSLTTLYETLNPMELRRIVIAKLAHIQKMIAAQHKVPPLKESN